MSPRGLTLLELLIALTLLLALGAIALPAMMSRLGERAFDTAADLTINHLLLARAYAQAERSPVEVIYDPSRPHLEARLFEPGVSALDNVARDWRFLVRPDR